MINVMKRCLQDDDHMKYLLNNGDNMTLSDKLLPEVVILHSVA